MPPQTRLKDDARPTSSKRTARSSSTREQKPDGSMEKKGKHPVHVATTPVSQGRSAQMSRTQKEKDRKKRSKAAVLMEHVDIIKDEFWDRRPWILSGKTV